MLYEKQQKKSSHALDRKIFGHAPQISPIGIGDHIIVGIVRDGPAASEGCKARSPAASNHIVNAVMMKESRAPAEPEAQMMRNQEGTRLGYNAQAVVEAQSGIIVAPDVSTDPNDRFQLVGMLQQVQETLGRVAEKTVAEDDLGSFDRTEQTSRRFHRLGRGVLR